jgi:diguanylate cyclase (GGDEF)-like protein
MLDLDNFKYVNDAFGHGAGDDLLRSIGTLLSRTLRETDVLARLGGDEFGILIPDPASAQEAANRLLEAIRGHVHSTDGRAIRLTTSIGVVVLDRDSESGETVLDTVDRAMYEAKDQGRDRAVFHSGDGGNEAKRTAHVSWEHRIREALANDLFDLHCQPILDLRTNEISQYELLVRMRGPDGLIPPAAFLGVAERLGLIHAIDRWVVTEAIRLLSTRPDLRFEVNLSARSVEDEQLMAVIGDEIGRRGVDPSGLIFEITETAAISSMDDASRLAVDLAKLGCRFALDDFGAGFGSFYYLKHLPADFLKIDGDFIRSPRSRTDSLVIESIVTIARGLGKQTIAEFVEDAATLEAMRAHGVDYAQGFGIGRPAPASELPA